MAVVGQKSSQPGKNDYRIVICSRKNRNLATVNKRGLTVVPSKTTQEFRVLYIIVIKFEYINDTVCYNIIP